MVISTSFQVIRAGDTDSDMDLDEQVESSSESELNDISGIMKDLEARLLFTMIHDLIFFSQFSWKKFGRQVVMMNMKKLQVNKCLLLLGPYGSCCTSC